MSTRSWTTRGEAASDVADVREILLAAFPSPREAELVDDLRADGAWIDGLSRLTVDGADPSDRPVGYALLTRCHIGGTAALCLAPVAVLPGWQRLGAGSAGVRAVLRAAGEAGERYVVVLGHPDYYPRFGFTRASEHGIGMSADVPDEALMALALRDGDRLPSGTVRYAEPFAV